MTNFKRANRVDDRERSKNLLTYVPQSQLLRFEHHREAMQYTSERITGLGVWLCFKIDYLVMPLNQAFMVASARR